jgi:hypothetical protein
VQNSLRCPHSRRNSGFFGFELSRCPECGASRPVSRVLYGARFRARDGHSSGTAVAGRLEQPTRATIRRRIQGFLNEKSLASPLFGLAPGGACHAAHVAMRAVRSYRTVSPLPCGGLFSVALSLGLPPPEVIRHRVSVEPGLSSAENAAAIRPAGPSHIGALGSFVNYRMATRAWYKCCTGRNSARKRRFPS